MRDYKDMHIIVSAWLTQLKKGKFYLDLGFQSRGRWSKADRKAFLYNLSSKLAPSKLIVCSIKKSLYPGEWRKGEMWPGIDPWNDDDGNPTNPDYIYFKNLEDRGYDYIVIDGNNRDITLLAFLGYFQSWDELGKHSMLKIEDAEKAGLFEKNSSLLPKTGWTHKNMVTKPYFEKFRLEKDSPYSKLSIEHKKYFDNVELTIAEYWTNDVQDLGEIFNAVNTGSVLNGQEMRNSWVRYDITELVRDFTTEHTEIIQSINGINWLRRGGDEMVVQFHSYSTQDTNLSQVDLNLLYQNDEISEWNKTTKHAKLTFDSLKEIGLKTVNKKRISRGNVIDMYDLIKTLDGRDGQKYKIKIPAFSKWWSDTLHSLKDGDLRDDVWYISDSQESQYEKYLAGVGEPDYEPFEENYKQAIRELAKRYGRHQRLNRWLQLLMEDPTVDKIVTSVDPQRIYTPAQTYQIWLNQDKKSLKTGNEILLKDLFNKEKYQTDHTIDYAFGTKKGGSTTVENGEVMEIEYHKEKTKNTWYNKTLDEAGTEIETVSELEMATA